MAAMTRSERALYALVEALLDVGESPAEVRAGLNSVAEQLGVATARKTIMRRAASVAERGW